MARATFVLVNLLKRMVLQLPNVMLVEPYCRAYSNSKTHVAKTNNFTTCLNKKMLNYLTVDISKIDAAETNGVSNIFSEML